ncbi:hypothetical protein [Halosimplex amylolyticum]|uniref:hypothetical protein n=1 Tax=Halosimplex amylolyticum TaxID=3396616 RepID=UPI003F54F275
MTRTFRTDNTRPSVSYGPGSIESENWALSINCEEERVDITLDEESMYHLWVEVRGVPWPSRENRTEDRLVRQVVHAANGADEEMLRDALEVLGMKNE